MMYYNLSGWFRVFMIFKTCAWLLGIRIAYLILWLGVERTLWLGLGRALKPVSIVRMVCRWEYTFDNGDLASLLNPQWKEIPPEIAVPLNFKLHNGQNFLLCEPWFLDNPGPRVRWSVKSFIQVASGKYATLYNQTRGWTLHLRALWP